MPRPGFSHTTSRDACFAEAGNRPLRARDRPEELVRIDVLKPAAPREARILRTGADVDATLRIEPMPVHAEDPETRQRPPAPADRWAGRVRAVERFDRDEQRLPLPLPNDCGNAFSSRSLEILSQVGCYCVPLPNDPAIVGLLT